MTTQPYVELLTGNLGLAAIQQVDHRSLGTPREVIEAGLMAHRQFVINKVKRDLKGVENLTGLTLLQLVDAAAELRLGQLNAVIGPIAAEAYLSAYNAVGAGDVPMSTIYALAEAHSKRVGTYYNETSKDALNQGFNTYVNRQIPARVAAERILDAYGLTPRQISGFTSLDTTQKVNSPSPFNIKARAQEYIAKSIRSRLGIFAEQEAHNLNLQAKQTAWLWLQEHGGLSEAAQKVWLTAKDEATCAICAPMHGKRAPVGERFELPNGMKVWTAGVHPSCRCDIRVIDPMSISKADGDKWFNDELTRDSTGRFARARSSSDRQRAAAEKLAAMRQDPRRTQFKEPVRGDVLPGLSEPVIEEETKVDLPAKGTLVPLPKKTALPSKMDLPPAKQDLAPRETTEEKADLQADTRKATLSSGGKQSLREDTKQSLRAGIKSALGGLPPKIPRIVQNSFQAMVPTVYLPNPVYAVIPGHMVDQHGEIVLDEMTEFTMGQDEAADLAVDMLDELVESEATRVNEEYGARITGAHQVTGEPIYADVEYGDVMDVIFSVGYTHHQYDNDEATLQVQWMTESGDDLYMGDVNYLDIAKEWEISPGDLDPIVIRLQEGHDSAFGSTEQLEAETSHGFQRWITSGKYAVNSSNKYEVNRNMDVPIYDLIPDVEVKGFFVDEPNE